MNANESAVVERAVYKALGTAVAAPMAKR
jgi:hypothetical protein